MAAISQWNIVDAAALPLESDVRRLLDLSIFMCLRCTIHLSCQKLSMLLFVIDRSIRDESSSINDAAVGE